MIEAEGLPRSGISLVREHTERINPSPRPLGVLDVPNDPEFQLGVLRSLLGLFTRPSGPFIEDYPYDSLVTAESDAAWSCTLPLPPLPSASTPAEALKQSLLQVFYDLRDRLAADYAEKTAANGTQPSGPPPPNPVTGRFAARPETTAH